MGDRVRFEEGDFRDDALRADVVMANLTGALLERSAATLGELVAPGGLLIVSGFMESERERGRRRRWNAILDAANDRAGRGMDVRGAS